MKIALCRLCCTWVQIYLNNYNKIAVHLHIFTNTSFVVLLHPARRRWFYLSPRKKQLGTGVVKSHLGRTKLPITLDLHLDQLCAGTKVESFIFKLHLFLTHFFEVLKQSFHLLFLSLAVIIIWHLKNNFAKASNGVCLLYECFTLCRSFTVCLNLVIFACLAVPSALNLIPVWLPAALWEMTAFSFSVYLFCLCVSVCVC